MRFNDLYPSSVFIAPEDKSCSAPYIRKVFTAETPKDAKITICGLGFFELYLNGKKVSDDVFVPANSLYEYRENKHLNYPNHDKFTYRTYSVEYDVTAYLKSGKNTLVVLLGNGWYGDTGNHDEHTDFFGTVKLCYKLNYTDNGGEKEVVSDASHKWKPSFIAENRLYLGEKQDMRLYDDRIFDADYDDSAWQNVVVAPTPECEWEMQHFPADKVIETFVPKAVAHLDGVTVYDCGVNLTGYVVVRCGKAGETIVVEHAEELNDDGTLYKVTCACDRKPARDEYISDGVHEMHPHFAWHGFRYFTLTDNAEPVEARMIHADMKVTSHFECDNDMLNWLYETYLRTQLENMHCGVPSDCPTRERLGYTGDGQLCADAALLMMDGRTFYEKWMQDIVDSQCSLTGHVTHTAPFQGGGGGIGGWGSAIIHVPYVYYSIYGDDSLIKKHFGRMLSFMRYLDSRCEAGFIASEEPGGWNLGDWGFSKQDEFIIPQNYVNTYYYIKDLAEMCEMAPLVGMSDLVPSYREKIEVSKKAMHAAYFSAQTGDFFGDYQGANAFATALGIGDERTYPNLVAKYEKTHEYDTGIFATDLLTELLFKNGNAKLAFELMTAETDLSFGNMKNGGATTLWEYMWGPIAKTMSHNHPMFGALTRQLFHGVLGIRQREGTYGYTNLVIDPAVIDGLNYASGHIDTGHGKIGVTVKRGKTNTYFKFEIPQGVKAVFRFEYDHIPLHEGVNEFDMQLIQ